MIFNRKYFLATFLLFFTEVLIALYVNDSLVRPYLGDFLVVILLYCLLKSFFRIPMKNAIFGVLLFAYFMEALQYFKISEFHGLHNNKLVSVVMGNHFEWLDMLFYTLGAFVVLIIEKARSSSSRKQ